MATGYNMETATVEVAVWDSYQCKMTPYYFAYLYEPGLLDHPAPQGNPRGDGKGCGDYVDPRLFYDPTRVHGNMLETPSWVFIRHSTLHGDGQLHGDSYGDNIFAPPLT